ncbi:DoxX family membrane protein [Candidatus Saccharibacteria bacterium]|nr:DoxX family membrane protein [Candidatus Saccharibacteria bacterium]
MAFKKHIADGSLYVWALLRFGLGFIFLWAFFDKLLGLGVATCQGKAIGCSAAWINGGSPTTGFLGHAVTGPFTSFYNDLAGLAWVDWLFMLGLLVVGVGLMLGIWVRVAALVGIVMLLLMWSALLWPANTPGLDDHLVYALVLFGVALVDEHQVWGLRHWWVKTSLAKSFPFLK